MINKKPIWRILAVVLFAILCPACDAISGQPTGKPMFKKYILKLSWEWPAGRSPQQSLLVMVDDIKKESNNTISNSASMADYLPDPMILIAHVLEGDAVKGTQLNLRLPKMELGNISANDRVVIGLDKKNISICIEKVPSNIDIEMIDTWFSTWKCS